MTNHFQRLDLTVNGVAKTFLNVKFGNWYANEVTKQLNGGAEVYSIEVNLRLTVLTSKHLRNIYPGKGLCKSRHNSKIRLMFVTRQLGSPSS